MTGWNHLAAQKLGEVSGIIKRVDEGHARYLMIRGELVRSFPLVCGLSTSRTRSRIEPRNKVVNMFKSQLTHQQHVLEKCSLAQWVDQFDPWPSLTHGHCARLEILERELSFGAWWVASLVQRFHFLIHLGAWRQGKN